MSRTSRGAESAAGSRPVREPRGWLAYLLLGGALVLAVPPVAAVSPLLDALCWIVLQGSSLAAVIVGIRRYGLGRLWAWRLIGAAVTLSCLASTLLWGVGWTVLRLPGALIAYQGATLLVYGLGLAALTLLGLRTGGSRWAGLLDSAVITVGVAMPFWTFFITPVIDHSGYAGVELAFALATPVMDLFMLGMVLRMASDNGRAPWLLLLSASYVSLLVADGAYLLDLAEGRPYGALSMIAWLGWAILVGGSALHPSVASSGRLRAPVVSSRVRAATFLTLALLGPLVSSLGPPVLGIRPDPRDGVTTICLTVLLAVLLVLRLNLTARLAENRALTLDHQAHRLATQADDLATALHHQERLRRDLAHRASHDPLTGLANRTLLTGALDAALTARAAAPPALLLLDLDDFKDVNDTYGHPVGDDLLMAVAGRLRALAETIEARPTLARLGGDEFALLLPAATTGTATALAHRILTTLARPYRIGERELHLTTSIGILTGLVPAGPTDALRDADLALHTAKADGKNQATLFHPDLRTARLHQITLATGLRHARARGELTLHYQPVVNLATGAVHALEALLRWTPASGDPVPPAVFIPIAEDTGLITDLGHWALDQAVTDARHWYHRHGTALTVNVSGRQLRDPAFPRTLLHTLARHHLPPHALILEITENTLLATTPAETRRITALLTDLRAHGVRIALDDFGTGYSCLSHLRTLPVDILKIDRSFTTPPTTADRHRTRAFTEAILQLSTSLGLDAIVEGVETPGQAAALHRLGAPHAQGHLFSPPLPAARIDDLLTTTPWKHHAA
ncbi:bifunctional diguanylate cyclase/phosphodiesterase [Planomonospora sp. ID82291]|uniref:putative bifunctional diguanylate cyclase/phosphodiesterase n=1 Tax=Planomonospora sp. ID82291 TaxID=2738136 RepID=UPI0018C42E08|nr:bifunctional diguanylate cyclase/phosphodiesterase [Planomonospora sp. ID82291]MBG0818577.1 GGDEF domain-containing protein [Planomonospora sp. ID82291]